MWRVDFSTSWLIRESETEKIVKLAGCVPWDHLTYHWLQTMSSMSNGAMTAVSPETAWLTIGCRRCLPCRTEQWLLRGLWSWSDASLWTQAQLTLLCLVGGSNVTCGRVSLTLFFRPSDLQLDLGTSGGFRISALAMAVVCLVTAVTYFSHCQ